MAATDASEPLFIGSNYGKGQLTFYGWLDYISKQKTRKYSLFVVNLMMLLKLDTEANGWWCKLNRINLVDSEACVGKIVFYSFESCIFIT